MANQQNKITLLFPGQGSQFVGMGKSFYENFSVAKEVFDEVDEALSQKLRALIFEGTEEELRLTQNAQPALMTVSMAITRTLEKEWGAPLPAAYVAGHSLGEYTAYCAAGSLSLSDTARLLRTRGTAMQNAVPVGLGAMAAILNLEMADVEAVVSAASAAESIAVIANDNSPGQVVISGHKEAVDRACVLALEKGAKRALLLPVSAPFHSPLMAPAVPIMAEALSSVEFHAPLCPLLANVTTTETTNPETARQLLVEQVTGRVRWRETMLALAPKGITHAIEIGAGKVLCGLMKRIDPSIESSNVQALGDITAFLDLLKISQQ